MRTKHGEGQKQEAVKSAPSRKVSPSKNGEAEVESTVQVKARQCRNRSEAEPVESIAEAPFKNREARKKSSQTVSERRPKKEGLTISSNLTSGRPTSGQVPPKGPRRRGEGSTRRRSRSGDCKAANDRKIEGENRSYFLRFRPVGSSNRETVCTVGFVTRRRSFLWILAFFGDGGAAVSGSGDGFRRLSGEALLDRIFSSIC